jgi:hypothetical protein
MSHPAATAGRHPELGCLFVLRQSNTSFRFNRGQAQASIRPVPGENDSYRVTFLVLSQRTEENIHGQVRSGGLRSPVQFQNSI